MPSLATTATAVLPDALPTGRRAAWSVTGGLVAAAVLLWAWWPAGVLAGLAVGLVTVLELGRRMQATADAQPLDEELVARLGVAGAVDAPAGVPAESAAEPPTGPLPSVAPPPAPLPPVEAPAVAAVDPALPAAVRLVVETQYASAARLQRDLHVPYARARRILAELERRRVVGPPAGTLPRRVLVPTDRASEAVARLGSAAD